ALLEVEGIEAGYNRTSVLLDVDLSVPKASVAALLGPNGAGKTTLLRVISGLLTPMRGRVRFKGEDLTSMAPHRRARRGVCVSPEGRGIFRSRTVQENLELSVPPWARSTTLEPAIAAFPALRRYLTRTAGSLSGGEQQMLALGRAYLSSPKLLIVDELSMGL